MSDEKIKKIVSNIMKEFDNEIMEMKKEEHQKIYDEFKKSFDENTIMVEDQKKTISKLRSSLHFKEQKIKRLEKNLLDKAKIFEVLKNHKERIHYLMENVKEVKIK